MQGYSAEELRDLLASIAELLADVCPVYAVIGGVSVSVYGRRARTRDVDVLVAFGDPGRAPLVAEARRRGWRAEIKDTWHLRLHRGPLYVDVISAGVPLQEEAARLGIDTTIAGVQVRVAPAEHVVALKIMAGRPRDRRDVEEIHEEWAGLDVAKVNALLAPFGEVWAP